MPEETIPKKLYSYILEEETIPKQFVNNARRNDIKAVGISRKFTHSGGRFYFHSSKQIIVRKVVYNVLYISWNML